MNEESIKRYIPLEKALMKHAMIVSSGLNDRIALDDRVSVTVQEWIVIELIVEQRNEYNSMIELARKVGIPSSSFSRIVSRLQKAGLILKYHIQNNRKSIVLRPSEQALAYYEEVKVGMGTEIWTEFFQALEHFSDSDIILLTDALLKLNDRLPSARYSQEIELVLDD